MAKPPIKQKYIPTPEDLLELWNEYKAYNASDPDIQEIATAKEVQKIAVKKPLLKSGFEAFVYNKKGFHVHQYIENTGGAYSSYLGVVTHMRKEWETDQIEGSLTGRYKSPNLVARLNGLTEKTENNTTLSGKIEITLDLGE
jgi:hypothetical protein